MIPSKPVTLVIGAPALGPIPNEVRPDLLASLASSQQHLDMLQGGKSIGLHAALRLITEVIAHGEKLEPRAQAVFVDAAGRAAAQLAVHDNVEPRAQQALAALSQGLWEGPVRIQIDKVSSLKVGTHWDGGIQSGPVIIAQGNQILAWGGCASTSGAALIELNDHAITVPWWEGETGQVLGLRVLRALETQFTVKMDTSQKVPHTDIAMSFVCG